MIVVAARSAASAAKPAATNGVSMISSACSALGPKVGRSPMTAATPRWRSSTVRRARAVASAVSRQPASVGISGTTSPMTRSSTRSSSSSLFRMCQYRDVAPLLSSWPRRRIERAFSPSSSMTLSAASTIWSRDSVTRDGRSRSSAVAQGKYRGGLSVIYVIRPDRTVYVCPAQCT